MPALSASTWRSTPGWNWLFFRAHRPWLAAVECAALTVSSADLVRRTANVDRRTGLALLPYPLWCGFATALTVALARRNPAAADRSSRALAYASPVTASPGTAA